MTLLFNAKILIVLQRTTSSNGVPLNKFLPWNNPLLPLNVTSKWFALFVFLEYSIHSLSHKEHPLEIMCLLQCKNLNCPTKNILLKLCASQLLPSLKESYEIKKLVGKLIFNFIVSLTFINLHRNKVWHCSSIQKS